MTTIHYALIRPASLFDRVRNIFAVRAWFVAPVIFLFGCFVTYSLYRFALNAHDAAVQRTLTHLADGAAANIGEAMELRSYEVMQSGDFWRIGDRISEEIWDVLAGYAKSRPDELQSVIWVGEDYNIRRIAPANQDNVKRINTPSPIASYLSRLRENVINVSVSSIVKYDDGARFHIVTPLRLKNGRFEGFLTFTYRPEAIFDKILKNLDPLVGVRLMTNDGVIYENAPAKEKPESKEIFVPIPFSNGPLSLNVFPVGDLYPSQTKLAYTFLGGGFILTILVTLIALQLSYMLRAQRAAHDSRAKEFANEQRYRTLITNCGLGWVVFDEELKVIEANEPYVQMTGHLRFTDIAGRKLQEWVAGAQRALIESTAGALKETHISRQSRTDYLWPDGSIRHIHADLTIRNGRNGKEIVALCRDVTDDIKTLESMQLLDRAVEACSNAILITAVERDGGKTVYCNRAYLNMVGYRRDEIVGKSPGRSAQNEENRSELEKISAAVMAGKTAESRLTSTRKNGERFIRHLTLTPVLDINGNTTHTISVSTDVTETERQAEQHRLHKRAIESVQNGIVIVDARKPDYPIIFINPAFEQITGYTAAEAIGKNCRFLQGEDRHQPELSFLRDALSGKRSASVIVRNYCKDGVLFWNDLHIDPVFDGSGELTHYIGIISDVTARKEAEAQLLQVQKMDAIGQLTGGVAHDFNNLLTVVLGNSNLLQQGISDEKQRRRLNHIVKAAETAADLTQRLLAFSRKQTLRTEVLDLNVLIRDLEHMAHRIIGENIVTKFTLSEATCPIKVDRSQLESALLNLAVNARDAMPKGGELSISASRVNLTPHAAAKLNISAGQYVEIAVSDTGIGMSKEIQERAFEPFFTTKEVGKGTGLGLSMVFGFVKQSGGHVSILSEMGHGTTVKLYLPSLDFNGAYAEKNVNWMPAQIPESARYKVLVVEDDENVRATTKAILENAGFEITEAGSAAAALSILETDSEIDVVFSDVVMPGRINGIELFRTIRKHFPRIHVALTSGYPKEALKIDLDDEHGPLLVDKPYNPALLARTLARLAAGESVKQLQTT